MKLLLCYLKKRLLNCQINNLEFTLQRCCNLCKYVIVQKTSKEALIRAFYEDGEFLGNFIIQFDSGIVKSIYEGRRDNKTN